MHLFENANAPGGSVGTDGIQGDQKGKVLLCEGSGHPERRKVYFGMGDCNSRPPTVLPPIPNLDLRCHWGTAPELGQQVLKTESSRCYFSPKVGRKSSLAKPSEVVFTLSGTMAASQEPLRVSDPWREGKDSSREKRGGGTSSSSHDAEAL